MHKRADEIEIGDVVLTEDGSRPHCVTGWFLDARGRPVLEWANQWHTFHASERLEVHRNANQNEVSRQHLLKQRTQPKRTKENHDRH